MRNPVEIIQTRVIEDNVTNALIQIRSLAMSWSGNSNRFTDSESLAKFLLHWSELYGGLLQTWLFGLPGQFIKVDWQGLVAGAKTAMKSEDPDTKLLDTVKTGDVVFQLSESWMEPGVDPEDDKIETAWFVYLLPSFTKPKHMVGILARRPVDLGISTPQMLVDILSGQVVVPTVNYSLTD